MSITISKGLAFLSGKQVRFVKSPNVGGKLVPEYIVIHDTASGLKADGDVSWLTNPQSKVSAHVVVARDGTITQLVPFNVRAWHAGVSVWKGRKYLNGFAVGIEIDNPGKMQKVSEGVYRNSVITIDTRKNPELVVKYAKTQAHGAGYWLMYSDEQVAAVEALCKAICSTYAIKDIITHWMISPGRKIDTNPLYPLDDLRTAALGFHPTYGIADVGDEPRADLDESADEEPVVLQDHTGDRDESAEGGNGLTGLIKSKWSQFIGGVSFSSVLGLLTDWRVVAALGVVCLVGYGLYVWSRKR